MWSSMMLICSEKMNLAALAMVLLNFDSMGRKAKSIMTGTVMDVAIIWVLLMVPIAAPVRREVRMPIAIIVIKVRLS